MPTGRLPVRLMDVMLALLLLVTVAELALKAYLIRPENSPEHDRSLVDLDGILDYVRCQEDERRFAASAIEATPLTLEVDSPKISDIPRLYSQTYGR